MAWAYYEGNGVSKNPTEAFRWFSKAAENDDVESQFLIGYSLVKGLGAPKDPGEGARWLQSAAYSGYAAAYEVLGELYFFGEDGVPIDYALAAKWYEEPARLGNAYAQYLMGHMYSEESANMKNLAEAIKWFQLAANQGELKAQNRLAWMYFEGLGTEQDLIEAYVWSNLSATASTGSEREEMEELRNYIGSQLSPEDLKSAQQKTRAWRAN